MASYRNNRRPDQSHEKDDGTETIRTRFWRRILDFRGGDLIHIKFSFCSDDYKYPTLSSYHNRTIGQRVHQLGIGLQLERPGGYRFGNDYGVG